MNKMIEYDSFGIATRCFISICTLRKNAGVCGRKQPVLTTERSSLGLAGDEVTTVVVAIGWLVGWLVYSFQSIRSSAAAAANNC